MSFSINIISTLFLICTILPHLQAQETAAEEGEMVPLVLESEPKLSQAILTDQWSQLRKILPALKKGENPLILDGKNTYSLGEILIMSRAWFCLKEMLKAGLKPTVEMMELCGEMGNYETYKLLLKAQGPMSPKQSLDFSGEALQIALEYSADSNATTKVEKLTPLMTHQEEADIALLLKHKADPHAQDINGRTALFYQRDPKCLELLLKAGADVNALDHKGHSAIDYWKSDQARQRYLTEQGGKSGKAMELIQITRVNGYTIALNDLDSIGCLISNEAAEGQPDCIVYYLAQRFPRAQVRQTQDWDVYLEWLNELEEESIIHRYERCHDDFFIPEPWQNEHELTEVFSSLKLTEGEVRIYCVCEQRAKGTPHGK